MHGVASGSGEEAAMRRILTQHDHEEGAELFGELIKLTDSDPDIDEMGLLVSPKRKGPPFILEEHKLGIAFWCIAPLYSYAFKLFTAVVRTIKCGEAILPAAAKTLAESSRCILMINPDAHTCWNIRKRLIKSGKLMANKELRYLYVIFTKHPKSGAAWGHRRWILKQIPPFNDYMMMNGTTSSATAAIIANTTNKLGNHDHHQNVVAAPRRVNGDPKKEEEEEGEGEGEVYDDNVAKKVYLQVYDDNVAKKVMSKYQKDEDDDDDDEDSKYDGPYNHPIFKKELWQCEYNANHNKNNYYAWTHREWLLSHITSKDALLQELQWIRRWNSMNVSQYSGFHFRIQVVKKLLQDHGGRKVAAAAAATAAAQLDANSILTKVEDDGSSCRYNNKWIFQLLEQEMKLAKELILSYRGFESLWTFRRVLFLLSLRLRVVLKSSSSSSSRPSKDDENGDKEEEKDKESCLIDAVLDTLNQELDFSNCTYAKNEDSNEGIRQKRHSATYQVWCVHRVLEFIQVMLKRDGVAHHGDGDNPSEDLSKTQFEGESSSSNTKNAVASTTKKNKNTKQRIVQLYKTRAKTMKLLQEVWPTHPLTKAIELYSC